MHGPRSALDFHAAKNHRAGENHDLFRGVRRVGKIGGAGLVVKAAEDGLIARYDAPIVGNPEFDAAEDGVDLKFGLRLDHDRAAEVQIDPTENGVDGTAAKIAGDH